MAATAGTLVISIDAELGWGFHDLDDRPVDRIAAARTGWRRLLSVLDAHRVPATWAVVGHLLLSACDRTHADHPAIDDWFAAERNGWRAHPEWRFAPDLVAAVATSRTDHEIAAHTFSHTPLADDRVTPAIARAELAANRRVAHARGIDLDSAVFPRNAIAHREALVDAGITCYRAGGPSRGRLRRTAAKLRDAATPRARLVEPCIDAYGLVTIPPSLYLFGFEGRPRQVANRLGVDPIVRQARHGIDRACREGAIFHVWLHPNNLQTAADVDRVRSIVAYAAARRDAGQLRIETMGTVAERVLAGEAASRPSADERAVPADPPLTD
ncbi:polysaccharide deacetylase family protein [Halococcoides cellulosivorans]|uniref:Polysaccharide deacetylase n=1 Tax=Halococcoides cellulosivorans TaxID=1679096 RepID=A0A2R4X3E7_9EURY|nr:polysaccharide deacetylase family protein [Halococcoides cellulosivorans]AWB28316.1 polysaccharide deacetylase [Halococcoides cellulosivorans]